MIGAQGVAAAGGRTVPLPEPVAESGPADPLDAALLAAHASGDRSTLVGLYAQAAARAEGVARAFFLTQAYVFALETGDARAAALRTDLVLAGADTA